MTGAAATGDAAGEEEGEEAGAVGLEAIAAGGAEADEAAAVVVAVVVAGAGVAAAAELAAAALADAAFAEPGRDGGRSAWRGIPPTGPDRRLLLLLPRSLLLLPLDATEREEVDVEEMEIDGATEFAGTPIAPLLRGSASWNSEDLLLLCALSAALLSIAAIGCAFWDTRMVW